MLLFKPVTIRVWLGKPASASLASLSLAWVPWLFSYLGTFWPASLIQGQQVGGGLAGDGGLGEGCTQVPNNSLTSLTAAWHHSPPLSHEVIQCLLPSKWEICYKWISEVWYFHISIAFISTDTPCSEDYATAALWMFREPMRVVGATRKFLGGRNISYLDILSGGVTLSPKANVEVEVNPNSVHRFVPDRLINKSSLPAFLSTISFPVRAQMQLNQDFLDNHNI